MLPFILKRLGAGLLVMLALATVTFFVMHQVPGGPFDQEKEFPPEIKANIQAKYHLDQPVWAQYLLYMAGLARGDLGPSLKYLGRTVNEILADSFPVSLQLGLISLLVALLLGIPAGIIAAVKRNSLYDYSSIFLASVGISIPNFVLGALLILFFAHQWKVLPPALWEDWRYFILPALALGAGPAAYLARLMRSSMLDVLRQEYISTARAKGLAESRIVLKHGLKNSIMPVITIIGPLTATLVTGSFIIEKIFSVPGMGKFFIIAVTNRDYPLIMGVTLVYAALIVLVNLLVDISYTLLDPRVRLE